MSEPPKNDDSINEPSRGLIFQPHKNQCPVAKEITHRLQTPEVIGNEQSVDVGGVCLSRDDFCPDNACCILCSFVAKLRLTDTSTSLTSVHFVIHVSTNDWLRRWMDNGLMSYYYRGGSIIIVFTNGANVFQKVNWYRWKPSSVRGNDTEDRMLGTIRLWKYDSSNHRLPEPKFETLTYIALQAKQWLSLCDADHEVCRSLCSTSTPSISLIDCNRCCLIHGFPGIRYVALSYVWGKYGRDFNLPERKYGVPLQGLPRTISDAIVVTKSLDYNYIWVDMLCIDQQSREDKHRQIAMMDQVYRSADLTIIVTAGSDCDNGIPGVSDKSRPPRLYTTIGNTILFEEKEDAVNEIEASIWRSRGWTFQEGLLSRRRLVFTDNQMLFSCLTSQTSEPREGPGLSLNTGQVGTYSSSDSWSRDLFQKDRLWDTSFLRTDEEPRTILVPKRRENQRLIYGFPISFAELLEKYSTLKFSFESDVVDAFRAIGNTFALRKPPVLHLCGLPFISDNESTTSSSLTRGLAWCLERSNEETSRRSGFPSWSWLGYRGPVRWGALLRDKPTNPINQQWSSKTFSHVSTMITMSNKKFELLDLPQWWHEWSSGKASAGLAPSRLIIAGAMIKQKFWLRAKCIERRHREGVTYYYIESERGWPSNFRYEVGDDLRMSAVACQCFLENLRSGSWRALLLTYEFLLIIQSATADVEDGPYRRVASADIKAIHRLEGYWMERYQFVTEYTELVEIELQ